jgi:hypothetical protein
MSITTIVALAVLIVFIVAYVMKKNARMKVEERD